MSYEYFRKMEEREFKFKLITLITIDDAIEFYKVVCRFPTNTEIEAINIVGVQNVLNAVSSSLYKEAAEDAKKLLLLPIINKK